MVKPVPSLMPAKMAVSSNVGDVFLRYQDVACVPDGMSWFEQRVWQKILLFVNGHALNCSFLDVSQQDAATHHTRGAAGSSIASKVKR